VVPIQPPNRHRIVNICNLFAAVALTLSLAVGLVTLRWQGSEWREMLGRVVVSLWTLIPPIYFWSDWYFLRSQLNQQEKEEVKHAHDLSRNIWLALVIVLGPLFGVVELKVGG
jgi:hypothetical protein